MSQALRIGSRLQSTGVTPQSMSQLRPMEPLIREGARAQVPPLQRLPIISKLTINGTKKLPGLVPLPREVVHAAGTRMAGRRL
jgi:hypothetical protein